MFALALRLGNTLGGGLVEREANVTLKLVGSESIVVLEAAIIISAAISVGKLAFGFALKQRSQGLAIAVVLLGLDLLAIEVGEHLLGIEVTVTFLDVGALGTCLSLWLR